MHTEENVNNPFKSRTDLTPQTRLKMACTVLFFGVWGTVTNLSRKYNVSRQFIYNEKHKFENLIYNNLNNNNLDDLKLTKINILHT